MSEMEQVLDRVGNFLAHKTAPVGCTDIEERDAAEFKKALRESGLLRLLEAGQAIVESLVTNADCCAICLQDLTKHASGCPVPVYWAARATMKESLK